MNILVYNLILLNKQKSFTSFVPNKNIINTERLIVEILLNTLKSSKCHWWESKNTLECGKVKNILIIRNMHS